MGEQPVCPWPEGHKSGGNTCKLSGSSRVSLENSKLSLNTGFEVSRMAPVHTLLLASMASSTTTPWTLHCGGRSRHRTTMSSSVVTPAGAGAWLPGPANVMSQQRRTGRCLARSCAGGAQQIEQVCTPPHRPSLAALIPVLAILNQTSGEHTAHKRNVCQLLLGIARGAKW